MEIGSAADWVGIAGSLLAIGVSVGLHMGSVAARREVDRAQARSAALAILPAIQDASRSFAWVTDSLKRGNHPDRIGSDESGPISVGTLSRHRKPLEALIPLMAALGAHAGSVQLAYRSFLMLDDDMASYVAPDQWFDDPVFVGGRWPITAQLLFDTGSLIDRARKELEMSIVSP